MPYKDPEKQKAYQREWQRKKQTGSVQDEKNFLNPDPATAKELLSILTAALNDIRTVDADPIIKGRAIAYLVNVGLKGFELTDFEERLKRIEKQLEGVKK